MYEGEATCTSIDEGFIMDQAILTELRHGPKTLEEICFRVHINQYEALHLLQQLNMRGKVRPMLFATGEVWYLAQP